MSVFRPKRSKNDFLDQENGLKRVENLFVLLKQNDIIMTAHNNSKMLSNAKMIFRRRKLMKIWG
jgi:3-dehydroquinate dehydratase